MKRAAVVLVTKRFHAREPQILAVTNRVYGGLGLPGGKVDEGEPPRRAAMRELYEETRLIAVHSDLTFLLKAPNVIGGDVCEVHMFFARAVWGEPQDVERGTRHAWVTMSELLDVSPFRDFYSAHLPDGVHHLAPTMREGSPPPNMPGAE
jgi:8-oxo-dGTP pyrophosphatase MutT (NUDIX family)